MTAFSEIKGRRVISRSSAESLGTVSDITIDVGTLTVDAFQVGKGRKAQAVAWPQVHGVGPDAVVAESEASLTDSGEALSPIDRLVLSDLGNALGNATDVEFDEESGGLISLVTEVGTIEAARLRVVGPYATIIVADENAQIPG